MPIYVRIINGKIVSKLETSIISVTNLLACFQARLYIDKDNYISNCISEKEKGHRKLRLVFGDNLFTYYDLNYFEKKSDTTCDKNFYAGLPKGCISSGSQAYPIFLKLVESTSQWISLSYSYCSFKKRLDSTLKQSNLSIIDVLNKENLQELIHNWMTYALDDSSMKILSKINDIYSSIISGREINLGEFCRVFIALSYYSLYYICTTERPIAEFPDKVTDIRDNLVELLKTIERFLDAPLGEIEKATKMIDEGIVDQPTIPIEKSNEELMNRIEDFLAEHIYDWSKRFEPHAIDNELSAFIMDLYYSGYIKSSSGNEVIKNLTLHLCNIYNAIIKCLVDFDTSMTDKLAQGFIKMRADRKRENKREDFSAENDKKDDLDSTREM